MPSTIFAVPPCPSPKGKATSNQNRQYQYFKEPFYAYPCVPAQFISMLFVTPNQQVMWLDGVAEGVTDEQFYDIIFKNEPDFVVFEANTMLINHYYKAINKIKKWRPETKVILCGEHPTALPGEAKEKSQVDYVLHGGKWYMEAYKIVIGKEWEHKRLPDISREVTRWWLYAYNNGNFKYVPATYTMFSQDCWHRPNGCTFCSWVHYHPETTTKPVDQALDEVEGLINMGFKEFFDDSGSFPIKDWFHQFCEGMIKRGYNKYIAWGCNMRFGGLTPDDMKLMAEAGNRFILWGFESANQATLDRLNKGYKIDKVPESLIVSSALGIWNHLTVMFGYPWENIADEERTYKMVRYLMLEDFASSAQATIFMPYPGTKLFKWAEENDLLKTYDWDDYDMTKSVFKLSPEHEKACFYFQKKIYDTSYHPKFLWNKVKKVRTMDDFRFYMRLGRKVVDRFGNLLQIEKKVGVN